jgi:MOSC domain-containing protein YiiM
MPPHVASLNLSRGGVPKLPVLVAEVTVNGLAGDWQRNRKYHGGPDRALCLYSAELLAALRAEGHPVVPGSLGENVTVSGVPWLLVVPGVRLRLGAALVEVASYTVPCRTIRGLFRDGRPARVGQRANPGWSRVYARVLEGGALAVGDPVVLLPPG